MEQKPLLERLLLGNISNRDQIQEMMRRFSHIVEHGVAPDTTNALDAEFILDDILDAEVIG